MGLLGSGELSDFSPASRLEDVLLLRPWFLGVTWRSGRNNILAFLSAVSDLMNVERCWF